MISPPPNITSLGFFKTQLQELKSYVLNYYKIRVLPHVVLNHIRHLTATGLFHLIGDTIF